MSPDTISIIHSFGIVMNSIGILALAIAIRRL